MDPVYHRLPIRLVPRTDFSIVAVVLLGIMTAAGIAMVLVASGQVDALNRIFDYHEPFKTRLVFSLFCSVFALPFLGAFIKAASKLLPSSPYFHLQVSGKGIVKRDVPRSRTYAWSELSGFRVVKRTKRRDGSDTEDYYYVNAVSPELVGKLLDDDPYYAQPVSSLSADEFGSNDDQTDAGNLAAWLNELRDLALKGELKDGDSVAPPAGFESIGSSIAEKGRGAPVRTPTIIRRQ